MGQDCVSEIFNPKALFFLFTGARLYYHAIYNVFCCCCFFNIYFASFGGYEDDICDVISNMHVQRCKSGGIMDKFGGMSIKFVY